jgi:hypothetical protein
MNIEEKIEQIGFPVSTKNHKILIKRLIIDNQDSIKSFLLNNNILVIQYTDANNWNSAIQLSRKIIELYLKNDLPLRNKIKYISVPELIETLKNERSTHIRNSDILIIDNFDYITNDYLARLILPDISYQIKNGYKIIFITNMKIKEIIKINKILQGLLNNYIEISY